MREELNTRPSWKVMLTKLTCGYECMLKVITLHSKLMELKVLNPKYSNYETNLPTTMNLEVEMRGWLHNRIQTQLHSICVC